MIPFVSPVVEAVAAYFQMTVADPCHTLHERVEQKRTVKQQAKKQRERKGTGSFPSLVAQQPEEQKSRYSLLWNLFRQHPERISPEGSYTPLRSDESLTEHYLASVYVDQFGSAHPRESASKLENIILPPLGH